MRWPIRILSIFAALWVISAATLGGWNWWQAAIGILPMIALLAWTIIARLPERGAGNGREAWRAVRLWSFVEGVGIVVGLNILAWLNLPRFFMPLIALMVGLHFVPLAYQLRNRLYYATAAAMTCIATVGALGAIGPSGVAVASAVTLFASALAIAVQVKRSAFV